MAMRLEPDVTGAGLRTWLLALVATALSACGSPMAPSINGNLRLVSSSPPADSRLVGEAVTLTVEYSLPSTIPGNGFLHLQALFALTSDGGCVGGGAQLLSPTSPRSGRTTILAPRPSNTAVTQTDWVIIMLYPDGRLPPCEVHRAIDRLSVPLRYFWQ